MALPALQKTWQGGSVPGGTDLVNKLITVGSPRDTLWAIKEALVNADSNPWTVIGSSDSVTSGMDAVDRWVSASNIVYRTTSNTPMSWICLQQTGIGPTFQIVLYVEDILAADPGRENFNLVANSGGYGVANGGTDGAVNGIPQASDSSKNLGINGTDWHGAEGGSDTDKMLTCISSTDGACTRIVISQESTAIPITAIGIEAPRDPNSSWETPAVLYCLKQTVASGLNCFRWETIQNAESFSSVIRDRDSALHNASLRFSGPMRSTAEVIDEPQVNGGPFFYGGDLIHDSHNGDALWGSLFDWYWVSRDPTGQHGADLDTFPAAGDRSFVCVGDVVWGWLDDSSTDLAYDFTLAPAAFVSSEVGGQGNGFNTITILKPAGAQPGDILVFFYLGAGGSSSQIVSRPSGWVNKHAGTTTLEGTTAYEDCDVKIVGYSEPSSYIWNLSGGFDEGIGAILCYRPAHATQLDVIAGAAMGSGVSSHTKPNVTTIQDQALVLGAYMLNRQSSNPIAVSTPPAGMTNRISVDGSAVSRQDLGLYVYEEVKTPAGLYTGKALTANGTSWGYGITAAIRALGT